MRLGTPTVNQGQMIERSYGWSQGEFFMRVHDRSAREVTWFIADEVSRDKLIDSSYEAGGANEAPEVETWTACEEPEDDPNPATDERW
jgi:hypothetical protein